MSPAMLTTATGSRPGTLRRRLAHTTAMAGLFAGAPVLAQSLPGAAEGTVVRGGAIIAKPDAATLNIAVTTQRAVIDWQTFNIGAGQSANFTDAIPLPSPPAPVVTLPISVLNRVVGVPVGNAPLITQSQILGSLTSDPNVSVYLLNPQGVLFGANSVVNVGSLIATTLQVDPDAFFSGASGGLTYTGASTENIEVAGGASLTASAVARGIIALIGAAIDTSGTLTASGEVALVAASDVTVSFDESSPLSMVIREGSPLSNPIVARNSINGSSILLAGATRTTVTDAVLDVQATLTATSAYATDQGIVLAAGPTTAANANVVFPVGGRNGNTGNMQLTLGGTLTATGAAGAIDVRAKDGILAPASAGGVATLAADQALLIRADAGGVAIGNATAASALITAGGGNIDLAAVGSTTGLATVTATAGSATLTSLTAATAGAVSGTAVTLDTASAGTTLSLQAGAGDLIAGSATATGNMTLGASEDVRIDSAETTGGSADITINGRSLTGRSIPDPIRVTAGRDLSVTTTIGAIFGDASGGRNVNLNVGGLRANRIVAGNNLTIDARSGAITADVLTATAGAVSGTNSGFTDVGTVSAGTDLTLRTNPGNVGDPLNGTLRVLSATALSGQATIDAGGGATIGTNDAQTINATAARDLTATRLTATLTSPTLDGLTATAATLDVGTAEATGATVRLSAIAGAATVGTLNAGQDAVLSSTAVTSLTGNALVERDLLISGADVRLGGTIAADQQAGRIASYTALTGTITKASVATGLLTIRADSTPDALDPGAIILDANAAIDMTGVALVTGDPLGTVNTADVGIRLATAAAPLTLGTTDARALLSVDAGHDAFAPLATGGAVTLGATNLLNSLALSTPGAIRLASVVVSGAGQSLSVTGTGAATAITATGTLSGSSGITVTTPGAVNIAGASGGTGTVTIQSAGSTASASGALAGATVVATAQNQLSLTSVNATAGAAALTSNAAGITVTGSTQATGNITVAAPGAVTMGNVRSTTATVNFLPTTATTTLTAGTVRAATNLSVARNADVTLAGVTTDTGTISLDSGAGTLTILGLTSGAGNVDATGATLALGAVTSTSGHVDIDSITGTLSAGALHGSTYVDVFGGTDARVASATATNGTLRVASNRNVTATGLLSGIGATVTAPGLVALADVSGGIGTASITSTGSTASAGAVSGAIVSATAQDQLSLSSVNGTAGAATLTSNAAGTIVFGTTQATGDVIVSAPGVITMAGVRSIAGSVSFLPIGATSALFAGAVRASTTLNVARNAAVTLGSAASDLGSVILNSAGGTLTVTGAINAAVDVEASAPIVSMGAVTATDGHIDIDASGGALTTGALQAGAFVDILGRTNTTVASANATSGAVRVASVLSDVTATGLLSGIGVTVTAPGVVTIAETAAGSATAMIESTGSTVTASGALTGASVIARAQNSLFLTSIDATAGSAALTSTAAGITVTGATQATGRAVVSAPGTVSLGSVRSTGADVIFSFAGATATLTAGAVRSATDLTINRGGDFTLASATSDTGAISLTSSAGVAGVTGATRAQSTVAANGAAGVAMGDVTARTGAIAIGSAGGALALGAVTADASTIALTAAAELIAGAVQASQALSATATGNLRLASATSTASAVSLTSSNATATVTGATRAQGDIVSQGAAGVAVGAVTSTGGRVLLASGEGSVAAGAIFASGQAQVRAGTSATLTDVQSIGADIELVTATEFSATGAITAQTNVTGTIGGAYSSREITAGIGAIGISAGGGLIAGAIASRLDTNIQSAGNMTLTSAASDSGGVVLGVSAGTLNVPGPVAGQTFVSLSARDAMSLGVVTSRGGSILLASDSASLNAAAVTANVALTARGHLGVMLGSAHAENSTVTLESGTGQVAVAGSTRAARDIGITAAGAIALAGVTSDNGRVIATGGSFAATGTVIAEGAVDIAGAASNTTVDVTSIGSDVALRSGSGNVTSTGTISGATGALVNANGSVSLATIATGAGNVTLRATTGAIAATTIDSAADVDASGAGDVTLGSVNARGTTTGGAALLVSTTGNLSTTSVATRTTLDAGAAQTLTLTSAAVGTGATLDARDIALATFGAGTLGATAIGGSLAIEAGDVRGTTALTKTGVTGGISIARLNASGPTTIASSTDVRADLLQGGATTVNAAGDVSGRTGGLGAAVSSLNVVAGGTAMTGAVTTTGSTTVTATGSALLTDVIVASGDLTVIGATVTLGSTGRTVSQTAAGSIQVTSASGAITGLTGLTLRSDSGGLGDRDVTLQSASAIAFQPGTLIAGGPDHHSALRIAAAREAAIGLDAVEARTIALPGAATSLTHTGPVTIAHAAMRDTLTIMLTGAANPALTIGNARVRSGDLSLDTTGTLSTGMLDVAAGTTTLGARTIDTGAITTRSLSAFARSGTAIFSMVDATAGGIAVTAATDLRLTSAVATGAIALTSTNGDVTGAAIPDGFGAADLTSSASNVTVRADSSDGIRGAVRVGAVAGAAGIDLGARTIVAGSLASSAGSVTANTRRDAAGITDQSISIWTIDAATGITLSTGNRTIASTAPIALDRATSSGGTIAITTINGGIAARPDSPRTILQSTSGSIAANIGGAAVLGSAVSGATTVVANSLDIAAASSTNGALTLTSVSGPLTLGVGTASDAVSIDANGALAAGTITGVSATVSATGNATLGTVTTRTGDLRAAVSGVLDAAVLDAARTITVDAGSARITSANARTGTLALMTRTGPLRLDVGLAGLDAAVTGPSLSIGTLHTGTASELAATGDLTADRVTAGTTLNAVAGNIAMLGVLNTAGDARVSATQRVVVGAATTPGTLTLLGRGITVTRADAGALDAAAGVDGINLRMGVITRDATIHSNGAIAIGTLDSAVATLTAATTLGADRLTTTGTLTVGGGTDTTLMTVEAGGDTQLGAGAQLNIGSVTTPAALTLAGRGVAVTTANAGSLGATAGVDGIDLRAGSVADEASVASAANIAIGTLDTGSATLSATTDLLADRLTTSGALTATAGNDAIVGTIRTGRDATLTASHNLTLVDVTAGTLLATASAGGIDLATANVAGNATIASAASVRIGMLGAGTADIEAARDVVAGSLTLAGTLAIRADHDATLERVRAGSNAAVTTGRTLTIGYVATPATLALTARGIAVTDLSGGTLGIAAGADGVDLRTAMVTGTATVASDGGIAIGALDAGSADIAATGDLTADRIATGGTLAVLAGNDATITTIASAGNAVLTGTRRLAIGIITTPVALALAGRRIAVTTLGVGTLDVRGGVDGVDLGTATVAGLARIDADGGTTIGMLDAGAIDIAAAGALIADTLAARAGLSIGAVAAQVRLTSVTGGAARIATGSGGIMLVDLTTVGDLDVSTSGMLAVGALDVGGRLTAVGASASFATTRVRGDASLAASAADLRIRDATIEGAVTLTAATDLAVDRIGVGATLAVDAGGVVALREARIAGDSRVTAQRIAITTVRTPVTLTLAGERIDLLAADVGALSATAGRGGAAFSDATVAREAAIASDAGLNVGTLASGSTRIVAAGTLIADVLTARSPDGNVAVTTTGGDLRLGSGTASGAVALTSSGATAVTGTVAAGTSYRIDAASIALGAVGSTARQSGGDVTLVARAGAIVAQGTTTLAGTRTVSLSATGASGAITFAPETTIASSVADVTLGTTGAAVLGTVTASAGAIKLDAADAVLTRAVSAQTVSFTNIAPAGITRVGDTAVGNETEFLAPATRFDLSNAEIAFVSAPSVTIASGMRDVILGAVGLGAATGATRFAINTTGRIDMLGRFVATGSTAARTIAIGSDGTAGRTSVIRIASTQAEGGRVLVDGGVLELTADRIGAGLDRDFLETVSYRTATGLGVEQVTREYVARPTSTLYAPGALGAAPYSDGILVKSGTLKLTYGRYALFQNTGLPGEQRGVVIGALGAPDNGAALRLVTPNSASNAFGLFGTIDGISSQATALLGPDKLSIDPAVSPGASRINGCVIGSGSGCLNTSIAQPTLNLFDTSRAEIVRTADDLTLAFDPLIGTNNEALYLDTETDAAATAADCEGDKPCSTDP